MVQLDVIVRGADDKIIEQLDSIVKKEKYASRSELIKEILTLYVTDHNQFFAKALTPTIKYLSKEVLDEQSEYMKKSLELIYNVNADLLKKMDEIYAVFQVDNNEK